ncbi:uncharacterized protein LOC124162765 [Ischnura elegans]|uniref:uncharacterized protein LOC124162765 n=1 Tax=Ischnura elegans TaxID=197161 RepID=UPI001ED89396|nr:uncharacterized protein LOC124162765 [Ischnura elegans]
MPPFAREQPFATGRMFDGGGHRELKHGVDYQLTQTIHLLLRAMRTDANRSFEIASDIGAGGKFDDIAWVEPKADGEGRLISLIQVKHVQKCSKKICLNRLLSHEVSKNPFSLPKYFLPYLRIKGNKSSDGLLEPKDTIQSLIILTNSDFAYGNQCGALELREDVLEAVEDEMLFPNSTIRFKSDFDGKFELALRLRRGVVGMPLEFSHCVRDGKRFIHKMGSSDPALNELEAEYWRVLTTEVISKHGNKFTAEFILGDALSRAARHFRDELHSMCAESDGGYNEDLFRKYLSSRPIQYPQRKRASAMRGAPATHANLDAIQPSFPKSAEELDSDLEDFLKKLKFVLNQPDNDDTMQSSYKELSERFDVDNEHPFIEIFYAFLRFKIDCWMNHKSANFVKKADLERFFVNYGDPLSFSGFGSRFHED